MSERDVRERDILVAPNEYAYVQDLTKGNIVLYVGPTKISLSNTERMILYRDGRFVPVTGDEPGLGVMRFVEATSYGGCAGAPTPAISAVLMRPGSASAGRGAWRTCGAFVETGAHGFSTNPPRHLQDP